MTVVALHGVYGITDPVLLADDQLLERVEAALSAGLCLLQYRNKGASASQQLRQAKALAALCQRYDVPLLINDNVALCAAAGAQGVHLGQSDTTIREARRILGPSAIIGCTCHNSARIAQEAQKQGASYVAVGRFFASHTKPGAPQATLDDLAALRAATDLPLVAIGGINAENGASLIRGGADMLAVIHYLFSTPDVAERTRALKALFQRQT